MISVLAVACVAGLCPGWVHDGHHSISCTTPRTTGSMVQPDAERRPGKARRVWGPSRPVERPVSPGLHPSSLSSELLAISGGRRETRDGPRARARCSTLPGRGQEVNVPGGRRRRASQVPSAGPGSAARDTCSRASRGPPRRTPPCRAASPSDTAQAGPGGTARRSPAAAHGAPGGTSTAAAAGRVQRRLAGPAQHVPPS